MRLVVVTLLVGFSNVVCATDLLRAGGSPDAMGAAGIVGLSPSPLAALSANPALTIKSGNRSQASVSSLFVDSKFRSSLNESAKADRGPGVLPEFALTRAIPNSRWSWGAGVLVQSAMRADFDFVDPNGTLGVSYGRQVHRSEYAVASIRGSIAYALNDALSVGATLGVAYNRNRLQAPYIFQSHPVLQGLKVLVDLDADDVAWNATLGLDYALSSALSFNLAYSFETTFSADGDVSGNLGQLGMGIQEYFTYDANVKTALPASLLAGLTWQASERLQLGLQYDWINWEDSFTKLPIQLTNGTNPDLNGFLGEDFIQDTAPLNWHDQHVIHLGGNYVLDTNKTIRMGVERGNSLVPRTTMTPMTAAILESAATIGMSMELANSSIDIAYRLSEGSDVTVTTSGLKAGEYSGTRQTLRLHSIGLSFNF